MQAEMPELIKSLRSRFSLEAADTVSEQELLVLLEKRLGQILQRNVEEFFQLLYRIDIPEARLKLALKDTDALATLAKMVYDRQLQKIKSRLQYKASVNNDAIDDELKW